MYKDIEKMEVEVHVATQPVKSLDVSNYFHKSAGYAMFRAESMFQTAVNTLQQTS